MRDSLAERVDAIRARMRRSAEAAGRAPDEVTLVAVCKRQPIERIVAAHEAGVRDFGENTAQGLTQTAAHLVRSGRKVRWHFVGGLQRNKVNAVLAYAPLIHSVDRLSLAEAIAKRAAAGTPIDVPAQLDGPVEVLIQVNIGREEQKGGVDPDEALELAAAVALLPGMRLRGLMAIPPADADPRPYFEDLRRLSEALRAMPEGRDAAALSMGMSDDFETAIACGATIVRVGTALFGPRES